MNATTDLSIKTTNLAKVYGKTIALKSLNMKVPKNATVAFLGPNGAGKTTTIKILLGLIRPTEGHATIFGMTQIRKA